MARQHIHIGVFIPSPSATQLLDTACVDIFAMMSHQYLQNLPMLPSPLTALAPDVTISYIGPAATTSTTATTAAADTLQLTANMTIQLTHHPTDLAVSPGNLDIVVVPGPDPRDAWDEESLDWLRRQAGTPGTDILSVCTGIFICGAAGLLGGPGGSGSGSGRGRKVCGPRGEGVQDQLARMYPSCEPVGGEVRWARDGNLWSSGGVTNGNDLVAAYCRGDGARFPGPLVEAVLGLADVGDRPQRYGEVRVV